MYKTIIAHERSTYSK